MRRTEGWLVHRLTISQQDDPVLVGLVSLLEQVAETVQQQADQIPFLASPSVTPEHLLPWLGQFIDVPFSEHLPVATQRDQVRDVGNLIHLRGTMKHVKTMVEPYATSEVSVSDDGGVFREGLSGNCGGNVVVRVDSLKFGNADHLIKLIRTIVPAHCTIRFLSGGVQHVQEAL
jgi:phage tail-like protein